ncbi:MAG: 3-oxoacyl-[acyl-carrier-protein] reductase [Pirellulales bacterium]
MPEPAASEIKVDLSGQAALVTGASRGLGRAMAQVLARNGAKVALFARSADKLAETLASITAAGGTAESYVGDMLDAKRIDEVMDAVAEKWGGLQILVNNAGITRDTLIPRMEDADFDDVIATNLRGTFLFTRAASRIMMRQRYGRIINIASVSGLMGNPGQANYSASKAGIIALTKTVARELAGRKVTANSVAPGFIESEMTAALGELVTEEAKKRIPAKRLGTAEEVASAVLFLASPAASYITGCVLTVDGGMTA